VAEFIVADVYLSQLPLKQKLYSEYKCELKPKAKEHNITCGRIGHHSCNKTNLGHL